MTVRGAGLALLLAAGSLAAASSPAFAQADPAKVIRIAWIDPLSGLMAAVGQNQLKSFQFFAEKFSQNNPAGVKFEIVGIDNKLSPTETLTALRSAIDQGVRYVVQGNGSGAALAIVDALEKHNARNAGKEVVYLNYSAMDPDLTNSRCSYWHFRFDADTSMKMEALSSFIKDQPEIKKVYLFNQNYAHGHQVSRYAKETLKRKRPDVEIVGDDLHPLAQVRDFAPYVAKIKQSGADAVITGNWGTDLSLLIRAAQEAGYEGKFFTYYARVTGTPSALGAASQGRVFQVGFIHYNMGGELDKWMKEFRERLNDDFYSGGVIHIFQALGQAMAKARSTEPAKVAAALAGLRFASYNGEVEMRRADHQLQQPLYITVWQQANAKQPYSPEKTGSTLAPVKVYDAYVASTPTSCQMKRP